MQRSSSYRQSLVEAIRTWLPAPFFSRWRLRQRLLWRPQRLVWMALLMAWSAEQTLTGRFEAVRDLLHALFPQWRLGQSYTGWYEAAAQWTTALQPAVAKRLRQQMQRFAGKAWTRQGWCAFAADGSRIDCPRTAANEAELGCAGRKRTGPQLYVTTLWHMGLGLPWDFRIGPGTASERRHLEAMLPDLPAGALVVADAGFVGYELCQRLLSAGQNFLLRVGSNVQLLQKLGYAVREGRWTVYLWPEKHRQRAPLVLRLIVLPQGKKHKMYLLTNVRDAAALPVADAAVLYEMRWGVEVFYRSTKQTLARRKMLSRTPEAARVELTWAILGIWLLGVMSVAGILAQGGDPLAWSVALARRHVRRAMRRAVSDQRCRESLTAQLAAATQDAYERHGSKKARDWPHKKREKQPGAPKIVPASAQQIRRAKRLRTKELAA